MTNNHKWEKGDRFRFGNIEGIIRSVGRGSSPYAYVRLDGAHINNTFDLDFFDQHAEYIPPPRPTFQEQFATLEVGDKFSIPEFARVELDPQIRIKLSDTDYASCAGDGSGYATFVATNINKDYTIEKVE